MQNSAKPVENSTYEIVSLSLIFAVKPKCFCDFYGIINGAREIC